MEQETKRVVVRATDLGKHFLMGSATVHALRGVDLTVEQGELVAILGPSGSGKSTLLGLLGGLDTPSSGRVEIGGVDITHMSENRLADIRNRKIGFVFQFFNPIPHIDRFGECGASHSVLQERKAIPSAAGGGDVEPGRTRGSAKASPRPAIWWGATARGHCAGAG